MYFICGMEDLDMKYSFDLKNSKYDENTRKGSHNR